MSNNNLYFSFHPVIPREFVQEWCLDYNFELVELDPEVDEDDDDVEGGLRVCVWGGELNKCILNWLLSSRNINI